MSGALISTSKIALLVKIIKRQPNARKEQATIEYKMQIWDLKKVEGRGEMSMLITFNVPEKSITEVASSFKQSFVFDSHKNEFYFADYNPRGALLVNKVSIVNSQLTGKGISAVTTNVETLNLTMNHVYDIVGQHVSLGNKPRGSLYQDFLVHLDKLYLAHGMVLSVIDLNQLEKPVEHLKLMQTKKFKNGGSRKSCLKNDVDIEALVMLDKESCSSAKRWQILVVYKGNKGSVRFLLRNNEKYELLKALVDPVYEVSGEITEP